MRAKVIKKILVNKSISTLFLFRSMRVKTKLFGKCLSTLLQFASGVHRSDEQVELENDVLTSPKMSRRCTECRQFLEDPELKVFPGDPHDAVSPSFIISKCLACS